MQSNHTKPQHPVADSPYQLHLFKQKDFVSLSGCCAKPAFCCSLNLYITATIRLQIGKQRWICILVRNAAQCMLLQTDCIVN